MIHAEAERGALRVAGMNLKLIHHGLHLRAGEERHEVVREEVGNADGADGSGLVDLFKGAPGARVLRLPDHGFALGGRPVNEEEVKVVDLQLLENHRVGVLCALE